MGSREWGPESRGDLPGGWEGPCLRGRSRRHSREKQAAPSQEGDGADKPDGANPFPTYLVLRGEILEPGGWQPSPAKSTVRRRDGFPQGESFLLSDKRNAAQRGFLEVRETCLVLLLLESSGRRGSTGAEQAPRHAGLLTPGHFLR